MADTGIASDIDPHDEIERLEGRIEDLAARLENCRKFILAGRIALTTGVAIFLATLVGVIAFDPRIALAAIAAMLGGIVLWGSNDSTAKEAAKELAETEAERAALIGRIELRVVEERPTLH